jgi:hypothetical protein
MEALLAFLEVALLGGVVGEFGGAIVEVLSVFL